MTLNGVIALILSFFSLNSIALPTNYAIVVEDRPVTAIAERLVTFQTIMCVFLHVVYFFLVCYVVTPVRLSFVQ